MGKKLNIEFIRAEFKKEGYELVTKVYKNSRQKLGYFCPNGHKHSISWSNWQQGKRCPCFSNLMKLTIEFIRADFVKEGYELLTKEYKNAHQKLDYICSSPEKHKHSVSWNKWSLGRRCPYCYGNVKPDMEFIRFEFKKEDYTLLTKIYKNAHQKLDYICPKGHKHSISWDHWNSKEKRRCPFCSNHVSKWEKSVKSFLAESNIDYIPNDRTQLLNPETGYKLELDMWMPNLNKAIECNGIYWHSKKRAAKNDKIKQQLCNEKGIDLLVITDKEWNDNIDKCKNKIQKFFC